MANSYTHLQGSLWLSVLLCNNSWMLWLLQAHQIVYIADTNTLML